MKGKGRRRGCVGRIGMNGNRMENGNKENAIKAENRFKE